ncbi:MAG: serine/threonine protein kinase, partial [Candidatus Wallbacteria bacterium]|nr:serine/threonine protein kinase [Candidatus Wallbacteria bacterium]
MIQVPGYRIARKIAAGSSGTVYLATQENLERRVAIKVLAPGLFDAWETRVRFLREAKVQASLAHPALVRVIDAGFSEDLPWLAMELVEGGSLRSLLSRCGRLEVAKAVEIGASIAGGLAHAHRKDIVHRDLKPENVLMTEDGRAKVTDFGLARVLKGGETLRTATGVILGTPGYIAPEVLLGHPVRTAADVYALGVILFELIAGAKPFEAEGIAELLKLQVTGQVPSLAAREPSVSPELDAFVSQCLARAPDERPSAAAVEASLRAQDSGPRFAAGSAAASG